jgi:hypothetical protein
MKKFMVISFLLPIVFWMNARTQDNVIGFVSKKDGKQETLDHTTECMVKGPRFWNLVVGEITAAKGFSLETKATVDHVQFYSIIAQNPMGENFLGDKVYKVRN